MYLVDDDEADVDVYPFHCDVTVDGSRINLYNLNTGRVRLCDNRILSREDVIQL